MYKVMTKMEAIPGVKYMCVKELHILLPDDYGYKETYNRLEQKYKLDGDRIRALIIITHERNSNQLYPIYRDDVIKIDWEVEIIC